MKTLEQLLAEWEEGTITAEGITELKQLLAQPAARAELVGEWLFYEAVYGTLRSMPAPAKATLKVAQPAAAKASAPARTIRPPVRRRRMLPWLVWHEFRLPLRWALGMGLAVCLAWLGYFGIYLRMPTGQLASVKKEVAIVRGGKTIAAQSGQLLYPRDKINVPSGGSARIQWLNEPTTVELSANASLELRSPLLGKLLALKAGSLKASVAPQPHWRPMTIKTPQARATVVGTRFTMDVTGNTTRMEVMEGAVSVRKNQARSTAEKQAVMVRAGELVLAEPGAGLKWQVLRGYVVREILELPTGSLPLTGSPGKVVLTDRLTNLFSEGRATGLKVSTNHYYEERIRCYIYPPATDNYIFWISSVGRSELWLSTDEDPADKRRIIVKAALPRTGSKVSGNSAWQLSPAAPGKPMTVLRSGGSALKGARIIHGEKSKAVKLIGGKQYYLEINQPFSPSEVEVVWWTRPSQAAGSSGDVLNGSILAPYSQNSGWAFGKPSP